jgi:hypothetical protein
LASNRVIGAKAGGALPAAVLENPCRAAMRLGGLTVAACE